MANDENDGQDQQTTQTNGWPEMIFEYDPEKSRTNKTKHGIDFEEAKAAWDDPNAVEFASEYGSEERLGRIARIYLGSVLPGMADRPIKQKVLNVWLILAMICA